MRLLGLLVILLNDAVNLTYFPTLSTTVIFLEIKILSGLWCFGFVLFV